MTLNGSGNLRAVGIGVAALILGGCTTYGTGTSPAKQTVEDLAGMVSLSGPKQESISYAPRPKVVTPPPGAALPEPGSGTAAVSDANWPRDPDELRKQQKALAANTPRVDEFIEAKSDPGFRLPSATPSATPRLIENNKNDNPFNQPGSVNKDKEAAKLYAAAKSGAAGKVDENGNPVRTTLTEPPSEYRAPDPTAPDTFTASTKTATKKWWWPFGN